MASDGRERREPRRALRIPLLIIAAVALALAATAAPASAAVVYDNAPAAAAPKAFGFEESGTAELGSSIRFDARTFELQATLASGPPPPPPADGARSPASGTAPQTVISTRVGPVIVIPPSRRMTLAFPGRTARIAGPGALVQVRCRGTSAARCIGTLSLSVAGTVHKVPYSISKGRRQYVVVPLGEDLELIDALGGSRATVTASTVQADGAAVTAKKTLRLK